MRRQPRRLRAALAAAALILLAHAASVPVHAARVPDLYSAEVEVPDGDLQQVFRAALTAVLVRVSGSRAAAGAAGAGFGDPSVLVQRYRAVAPGRWLVGFDPVALRQRMDQAGLPTWADERPATLVWLAVDAGRGEREILAAASGSGAAGGNQLDAAREALQTAARERGLPLLLPLVDSEDLGTVSFPELWGDFSDAVDRASERYRPDAVLVGRTRSADPTRASVRWSLSYAGERTDWTGGIADGPEVAADWFAERLATPAGSMQPLRVEVRNIRSLDDYGQVFSYLAQLGPVERCDVDRVAADRVLFRLQMRGDANQLLQLIALRRLLQPIDDMSPGADLRFALVAAP